MIRVFNKPLVQAASLAVAFSAVNPMFAATAAAETANSIEWVLQAGD